LRKRKLPSTPFRNFFHRATRIGKRHYKTEVPKDDPIRDPFRAYRDPAYYSKLMAENYTRARGWQESFEIWMYMKEKKWGIWDLYVAMCAGTFFMWRTGYEPWNREHLTYTHDKWKNGQYHTMFTSMISHSSKWHLLGNVGATLLSIKMLRGCVNLNYLFGTFCLAHVLANFGSHFSQHYNVPKMGGSAGVCCLVSSLAVFFPWRTMEVYIPYFGNWHRQYMWRIIVLLSVIDFLGIWYDNSPYGHQAHMTGWVTGFLSACLLKRFHLNVPVNHLWRKPVFKIPKKPPLWDMNHWAKLHAQGRGMTL